MSVFIGINKDGFTTVYPARDYQELAYQNFMKNNYTEKSYSYPVDIEFKMTLFDDSIFEGTYPRFVVLSNNIGEEHILSDDEETLKGFCGWKNRITN